VAHLGGGAVRNDCRAAGIEAALFSSPNHIGLFPTIHQAAGRAHYRAAMCLRWLYQAKRLTDHPRLIDDELIPAGAPQPRLPSSPRGLDHEDARGRLWLTLANSGGSRADRAAYSF
jgi:hypothetical protein